MVCTKCGGQMCVIAFLTDYAVVDKIIDHLKLKFVAEWKSLTNNEKPKHHILYSQKTE
jgi:hypothetical protein